MPAPRPRSPPVTSRPRAGSWTSSSRAFGQAVAVPAQGQGTMNNLTLGSDRFTYYETVGGGQGACPDADGPSGVHVAMSNTLSTPTEALELAYPAPRRAARAAARLGRSGRAARWRRRRPRAARARGLPALAGRRTPEPGAAGGPRRRARAARPQPAERRGAAGEGHARAARGRRRARRDAGWRRLRTCPKRPIAGRGAVR